MLQTLGPPLWADTATWADMVIWSDCYHSGSDAIEDKQHPWSGDGE